MYIHLFYIYIYIIQMPLPKENKNTNLVLKPQRKLQIRVSHITLCIYRNGNVIVTFIIYPIVVSLHLRIISIINQALSFKTTVTIIPMIQHYNQKIRNIFEPCHFLKSYDSYQFCLFVIFLIHYT